MLDKIKSTRKCAGVVNLCAQIFIDRDIYLLLTIDKYTKHIDKYTKH